jgi:hypothetical protein
MLDDKDLKKFRSDSEKNILNEMETIRELAHYSPLGELKNKTVKN